MPFIKVFTNQSQPQLGEKFMPTVCEKLGQALNKDLKWFNWILETDKQMSKGADNENQPFLWMELRALRIFDTKEQVQEVMPKVFEVMTQVSGLKNDQMFILIAPMEPFYIGLEGKVFP
eukprot:03914.XXX_144276_144684_1 [CDS] Oithona nana genome sequencing.